MDGGEVFVWDESGFRADAVHGRTWGVKGQTPVVARPGQRQSISAASAVNARGGFWYCTYEGGLTAELFVRLLRRMMRHRSKPVHLSSMGCRPTRRSWSRTMCSPPRAASTFIFCPGMRRT